MSYIGASPTSAAFLTNSFSGDGTTTSFTLSVAPASSSSILVAVSGVLQDPATYAVVGTSLNFTGAPPSGTANIIVRFLGIPASNVATASYRTVAEFTATAAQTTFSVPSYTPGFIDVYRNGVMLGSADYTATNGTTVVLASGATAGDLIEVISFYVSSIYNAISNTAGSVNANNIADGAVGTAEIASGVTINFADGSASAPSITNDGDTNTGLFFPAADSIGFAEGGAEIARFNSSGNLGIGTSSPDFKIDARGASGVGIQVYETSTGNNNRIVISQSGTSTIYNSTYSTGSGNHVWQVGNTEYMKLDSAGRVTTPFQPAFHVWKNNGNLSSTSHQVVVWNNVYFNNGGHYSNSTGRFTAPVAGAYYFSVGLLARSPGAARICLFINGTNITGGGVGPSLTYISAIGAGEVNQESSVIVQLAANDFVDIRIINNSGDFYAESNVHNHFTGYLIG